jgi:hypothetical protein
MTTQKKSMLIWGIICILVVLATVVVHPQQHQITSMTPPSHQTQQSPITTATTPTQLHDSGDDTNGTHLGKIVSIGKNPGNAYMLKVDYATLVDCSTEGADTCPNDYRITNTDSQTRSFYVNHDATVLVQTYPFNSVQPPAYDRPIPLDDFIILFNAPDQSTYPAKSLYYWITIKDGVVTTIDEQYQP